MLRRHTSIWDLQTPHPGRLWYVVRFDKEGRILMALMMAKELPKDLFDGHGLIRHHGDLLIVHLPNKAQKSHLGLAHWHDVWT